MKTKVIEQLDLFPSLLPAVTVKPKKSRQTTLDDPYVEERTMIGGIYTDNPDWKDKSTYYDGQYALAMGRDAFYFIFNDIYHIEEMVELACKHHMIMCDGYALAINKMKKIWQIRNSGRKLQPDYIIAEGTYNDGFEESLRPLMKVFHK